MLMLKYFRSCFCHKSCWEKHFFRKASSLKVLGIESSFDETGCAIVNEKGDILGESLFSHLKIHLENGGVIPGLSRKLHKMQIQGVVDKAVDESNISLEAIDAIAVTVKPGMYVSLMVGYEYAKKLCVLYKKPMIPIHHMQAHSLTIRMMKDVKFPFITLLISGGHCLLALAQDVNKFLLLGQSKDDAPGELFDKVFRYSKMSNLEEYRGLSGGAAIEKAAENGNPIAFKFPHVAVPGSNFSFSGLKNAARVLIKAEEEKYGIEGDGVTPSLNDICASIQYAVARELAKRLSIAVRFLEINELIDLNDKCLVVSGGVACNKFIQNILKYTSDELECKLLVPTAKLCTDNGVMIAWNGIEKLRRKIDVVTPESVDSVEVEDKCPIGEDYTKRLLQGSITVRPLKLDRYITSEKYKNANFAS